ncbi:MAG: fatty acid desaturase [Salinisphaeraceae bacterium]|nr:fatty acid desaturase [Salinisphaeraceae bacterium]
MDADLAALNKQAVQVARQYMGHVAWPTVMLVIILLACLTTTLGLFAAGMLPVWAAIPLVAAITYLSYTPLHEAVHGNISSGRASLTWLNDACGYLVAAIFMVPYASHKVEHFTHHRYTNQPDKDPDYMVSDMARGPIWAMITTLRFLWLQNSFFFQNHWSKATSRERAIYLAEISVALGWRAVFIALSPQAGTAVVIILGYLIGGFFTAYWFAYRPHVPYKEPARYRNTNSLIMPRWMKPIEWFWMGQNLHSIHHLFPRVPFYRYHALHREIEPILRAHGTPIVGIFSREPVEADANSSAR